jgi:hypothetical protein
MICRSSRARSLGTAARQGVPVIAWPCRPVPRARSSRMGGPATLKSRAARCRRHPGRTLWTWMGRTGTRRRRGSGVAAGRRTRARAAMAAGGARARRWAPRCGSGSRPRARAGRRGGRLGRRRARTAAPRRRLGESRRGRARRTNPPVRAAGRRRRRRRARKATARARARRRSRTRRRFAQRRRWWTVSLQPPRCVAGLGSEGQTSAGSAVLRAHEP